MFSKDAKKQNVKLSKAETIIIDTFFETLDWKKENPSVNLLTYGHLMSMVDLKNRWVYKGTLTTPPCTKGVYWNVLHSVYPVKAAHLADFQKKLTDSGKAPKGNARQT